MTPPPTLRHLLQECLQAIDHRLHLDERLIILGVADAIPEAEKRALHVNHATLERLMGKARAALEEPKLYQPLAPTLGTCRDREHALTVRDALVRVHPGYCFSVVGPDVVVRRTDGTPLTAEEIDHFRSLFQGAKLVVECAA